MIDPSPMLKNKFCSKEKHECITGFVNITELYLRTRIDITKETKLELIFDVKNKIDDILMELGLGYVIDLSSGFSGYAPTVNSRKKRELAFRLDKLFHREFFSTKEYTPFETSLKLIEAK